MLDDINFTLHLIRHGQSAINAQPDLMGQEADTPLTPLGESQAQHLHEKFQRTEECFDYVYSSHYTRAFDTCKIAMGDTSQPIILAEELREYSAGDWTGASRKANLTADIKLKMGNLNHHFLPPNGESITQVERRASEWLEKTILYNEDMIKFSKWKLENEHPALNIAIFSHGLTIKCLLHYIMGFDKSLTWKLTLDNTSVSKVSFNKEGWRIHSINDCSHL